MYERAHPSRRNGEAVVSLNGLGAVVQSKTPERKRHSFFGSVLIWIFDWLLEGVAIRMPTIEVFSNGRDIVAGEGIGS